jgi:hypothetical protein
LELHPGKDLYDRPLLEMPDAVEVEGDTEEWQSYEIEKIIKDRTRRFGRKAKPIKEYLIRWKGYGAEYDEWYGEDMLDNAKELVAEYKHSIQKGKHPEGTSDKTSTGDMVIKDGTADRQKSGRRSTRLNSRA